MEKKHLFIRLVSMIWVIFMILIPSISLLGQITGAALDIKGLVTDEDGAPLIGVSILETSTGTGTVTDLDGRYTLSITNENAVIQFSYIGYETQSVTVGSQRIIDISLTLSISELGEVVVVGYGTQRKSDLTGSLVSAPLDDFREAANSNILQSLSGSTPGISIGQTSVAGEEPSVQIRGQTSINGNKNPLIILDGGILQRTYFGFKSKRYRIGQRAERCQ